MDTKQIVDALAAGARVVAQVAGMPGVSVLPYAAAVASAAGAIQAAIAAGRSVAPYVEAVQEAFSSDEPPTLDQVAALDAKIAALEAEVSAPLPPAEPGEPE